MAKTDMEIKKGQPIFKDAELFKSLKDGIYEIDIKNLDMRTVKQNSAIYVLFDLIAKSFNLQEETVNSVLNWRLKRRVKKVFSWGKEQFSVFEKYPTVYAPIIKVLNKMEEGILKKGDNEIEWNSELVKALIWKKFQIKLIGKESTTKLTRKQIDLVYDEVNSFLGSEYGIHIPFPNKKLWDEEKEKRLRKRL